MQKSTSVQDENLKIGEGGCSVVPEGLREVMAQNSRALEEMLTKKSLGSRWPTPVQDSN